VHVELLSSTHNREGFDCGLPPLNHYLKTLSGRHTQQKTGRTFVLLSEPQGTEILGYHTLAVGGIESSFVPVNLPHHPVPVVHLGRLAVALGHQGKGLGEFLLLDALQRATRVEKEVAVYAIEVIAKDEQIKKFYLKYGFKELLDDKLHLYLSMKTVLKLFP
jgi:GNAT superfamily N-acetyltransferase